MLLPILFPPPSMDGIIPVSKVFVQEISYLSIQKTIMLFSFLGIPVILRMRNYLLFQKPNKLRDGKVHGYKWKIFDDGTYTIYGTPPFNIFEEMHKEIEKYFKQDYVQERIELKKKANEYLKGLS